MRHPSQPPPTLAAAIQAKVGALVSGDFATIQGSTSSGFALQDVVKCMTILHQEEGGGEMGSWCSHCFGDGGAMVPWPCGTVKVIAGVLGLKDGDWR